MAKRKYVKENNLVKAINTDSLELQKPLVNEYYDINVHNSNMDKIDLGYRENKASILDIKAKVDNGQNHKLTNDNGTCIQISESDLNDLKKAGLYYGWGLKNAPSSVWFYVEVFVRDSSYVYQRLTSLNDHNMTKYERTMRDGTWEEWKKKEIYERTNEITYLNGTYKPSWAETPYITKIRNICIIHCAVANDAISYQTQILKLPPDIKVKQHNRLFGRGKVDGSNNVEVIDFDITTDGIVSYYGKTSSHRLNQLYIHAILEVE